MTLVAELKELEGVLLDAASRAGNLADPATLHGADVKRELVDPLDDLLTACRSLQAEYGVDPWSL